MPDLKALEGCVEEIAATVRELEACLRQEIEVMRGADPDALHASSATKARLTATLQDLEARRSDLATGAGRDDFRDLLGAAAAERWRTTLQTLARCQTLNGQIGVELQVRQRYTGRHLRMLRKLLGETELYGPGGSLQRRPEGRNLGSA